MILADCQEISTVLPRLLLTAPAGRVDDRGVLVRTELLPLGPSGLPRVRAHTPVGSAVVVWRGDLDSAAGRHHVEWTVDEDVLWGRNTRSAALAEPGVREEAGRVVLRGRLQLTEDGAAVLEMGDSRVLFEIGSPPPPDSAWVEISVEADRVELYPYLL
ncbi:hypothetical protein F4556_007543 [Kitasatospora gansuensis]|uniref:Uncharacterized protein n=1 Tax=Kitasatospora gansuensis TaxID=258050 RepID=A0A7W7SJZ6_9ACTN|nr:hypothetical protein [Kitasatospora gansuensis]MBB4951889.1 hypothetical protein [Kitasatospora gansuensis]